MSVIKQPSEVKLLCDEYLQLTNTKINMEINENALSKNIHKLIK